MSAAIGLSRHEFRVFELSERSSGVYSTSDRPFENSDYKELLVLVDAQEVESENGMHVRVLLYHALTNTWSWGARLTIRKPGRYYFTTREFGGKIAFEVECFTNTKFAMTASFKV